MTDAPLISVCIANYNGAEIISACIESVLVQEGNFPVEILVHDDASTDDSADIVARDYPGVRLIRSKTNVGFCIANNRMVAEAQGEFILLLNNDAELFPDALRMLLSEARSQGKPAILSLPQYDYHGGELIDRGCLLDPFFNPVPNLDPKRQDVAMVIGACLWIPKKLWDELDGFPEWFGSIAEDMYLCCRARLANYAVCALNESGYRHRVGQSFGGGKACGSKLSTTFRRRALSERNKTFVLAMTYPAPFMQIILPVHLFLLCLEGVCLSMLKFRMDFLRKIYLPVFADVWSKRKTLLVTRAEMINERRAVPDDFFECFDLIPYKLTMLMRHGFPEVK
ncbi:glycosyltransferase family 2 protein [Ferribacterium limneticum]|uniref:glycosyltransferase family 2 protein n=1 Tax=Ferribacterium limneticum TaxID=76259 RepID=UPI001CF9A4EB|nr:glycosyltransferase [Ferribacterium limneticum]